MIPLTRHSRNKLLLDRYVSGGLFIQATQSIIILYGNVLNLIVLRFVKNSVISAQA